jgi:hypothetical protein
LGTSVLVDKLECGLFVETANKGIGITFVGNWVRQEGNYSKSEKWTLLLAVADGSQCGWKEVPPAKG